MAVMRGEHYGGLQTVPLSEVIARPGTSAQRLSTAQAAARLRRDGPNEIIEKRRSPLLEFAQYFWAPIPWMIEAVGSASERDGLGRGAGRACTDDGSLRVGVDRYSSENTPHVRRVELSAAPIVNTGSLFTHCSPIPNSLGELAAAMLAKRVDAEPRPL
jgi:hypothetical protein